MKEKQGMQSAICQAPSVKFLFPFYLNGDVTPEESRQIESHVPECRECQRKLSCMIALSEQGLPSWRSEKRGFHPSKSRLNVSPRH